jgi:hypothetical protein
MYLYTEYTLLWSVQPLPLLSLTLSLPPRIIQQLSICIVTSSTFTDVMYFDIVDALSFFFPFPPPSSSIAQFHYHKHVLRVSLHMIMFIFWICLPHMRDNMWSLSFWTWLTSLNTMSSNSMPFFYLWFPNDFLAEFRVIFKSLSMITKISAWILNNSRFLDLAFRPWGHVRILLFPALSSALPGSWLHLHCFPLDLT